MSVYLVSVLLGLLVEDRNGTHIRTRVQSHPASQSELDKSYGISAATRNLSAFTDQSRQSTHKWAAANAKEDATKPSLQNAEGSQVFHPTGGGLHRRRAHRRSTLFFSASESQRFGQ
jgi:hypothetical protein